MKNENTRNHGLAMSTLFGAVTALFSMGILGCNGATVGSVCDKWNKQSCPGWEGKSACESAGEGALGKARDTNCETPFQEYLQCVEEANSCAWDVACADEKAALKKCQGSVF